MCIPTWVKFRLFSGRKVILQISIQCTGCSEQARIIAGQKTVSLRVLAGVKGMVVLEFNCSALFNGYGQG
jgi:hypothetical protein